MTAAIQALAVLLAGPLVGCEIAFRRSGCLVFQMQLAKAVDSVPMTRDYMLDWEREQSTASNRAA